MQRKEGADLSLAGLRSILRHDPDKIMVGEIRDEETAQIAIQSALTWPSRVHDGAMPTTWSTFSVDSST